MQGSTWGTLAGVRTLGPLLTAVLAGAVMLAGCGGGDGAKTDAGAPTASMEHVHGLGVSGGTLYIATHEGLWLVPAGQTKARRQGPSEQDLMGFSVVDGGRFIASGHPAPSQDLPPNLGLIESRNGGRSWSTLSLSGEADFHVLESSGSRIYGFDGTQARLLVSSDGGRAWQQRSAPAAMFALAIHPADRDHVVASTEGGVFASSDAGRRWRALAPRLAGLLAWPRAADLYMVDAQGQVLLSRDAGRHWQPVGSIGGQPSAFLADGRDLYAALADGTVKQSIDGGRSWTVRVAA
jgi:hypothetical protein